MTTTQKGTLRNLCIAYYHPDSPANILSFSQLRKAKHDIVYTTAGGSDAFVVTTSQYSYRFDKRHDGLYICDLSLVKDVMISTVHDNETAYSKRVIGLAKAARSLQERMATKKLAKAIAHGNITYRDVVSNPNTFHHRPQLKPEHLSAKVSEEGYHTLTIERHAKILPNRPSQGQSQRPTCWRRRLPGREFVLCRRNLIPHHLRHLHFFFSHR